MFKFNKCGSVLTFSNTIVRARTTMVTIATITPMLSTIICKQVAMKNSLNSNSAPFFKGFLQKQNVQYTVQWCTVQPTITLTLTTMGLDFFFPSCLLSFGNTESLLFYFLALGLSTMSSLFISYCLFMGSWPKLILLPRVIIIKYHYE